MKKLYSRKDKENQGPQLQGEGSGASTGKSTTGNGAVLEKEAALTENTLVGGTAAAEDISGDQRSHAHDKGSAEQKDGAQEKKSAEESDGRYEDYDDYDDDYEDEDAVIAAAGTDSAGSGLLIGFFSRMSVIDRVMLGCGAVILVLLLATGITYAASYTHTQQVAGFATVGMELEDIDLPGKQGLLAVAEAEADRLALLLAEAEAAQEAMEEEEEEENTEYEEIEYVNAVTVKMTISSIEKDLKIKFTNKSTGKLISNVPFAVSVTFSDGTRAEWTDDDMDGIIYMSSLTAGNCSVEVLALSERYANYTLPDTVQTAQVKAQAEYLKVDVSDEIKTEAEIDVSQEDTKQNETPVEETLTDTVEWVDSTVVMTTYYEVDKSTIVDPLTVAYVGTFTRLSQVSTTATGSTTTGSISESSLTLAAGGSATLSAMYDGEVLSGVTWSSSDTAVATVDASGNVTAVSPGTAVISYTTSITIEQEEAGESEENDADEEEISGGDSDSDDDSAGESSSDSSSSVSGGNVVYELTASCTVTVTEALALELDQTAATVYIGTPVDLTATVSNAMEEGTLTAESSDTRIATVAVDGIVVTVTGVEIGSAVITVTYEEDGVTVVATCAVTVKEDPALDYETPLLDTEGNQVYVMDGSGYREAASADYYTATKFYILVDPQYTGWQTINGSVYYFDENHEKVTGTQVIGGATYNFSDTGELLTDNGILGIDVSKWNGTIDWSAVKNSGVQYVIIRCGYRGSSQGMLVEDPMFETNIKGAINAGLKVGVYFFTQAISVSEAIEEASMVLELVQGYKISYPIFLDVEASGGRADSLDAATRTAICVAFCETIQNSGYTAGIYANKTWLTTKLNASSLSSYKIWLAQYASTPTYTGKYDLWQYQSTGKVSGISGTVDMNWSYLGY